MENHDTIAVIGAGIMGEGMASCLIREGYPVGVAAHRNRAPVDRLVSQGAREYESLQALVAAAGTILTCLPNSDILEDVLAAVEAKLRSGALWLDVTTADPARTPGIAERIVARGARFADAPITGGATESANGQLTSLVGCDPSDWTEVEQLASTYSSKVRRVGPVAAGHTAKLLNNLVSQGTMILLAQAYRAAREKGIDWVALHDAMSGGGARSAILENVVTPALNGDYDAGRFTIRNAEKDLRYAASILSPGETNVAEALRAELADHIEAGHGDDFISRQLAVGPRDRVDS